MPIHEITLPLFNSANSWEIVPDVFEQWINQKASFLSPGLTPQPTIKVLIFLALLDSNRACTYSDITEMFNRKGVIKGRVPDNTLRTSILNLGKTLNKFKHAFELKSFRGSFELAKRSDLLLNASITNNENEDLATLILHPPAFTAEKIANTFVKKGVLPFLALYFLEWSARWWEAYSNQATENRVDYETGAWEKLRIKERLYKNSNYPHVLSFVSLAPGEGLGEISLLKKILQEENAPTVHYLAVDSSPRLLRDHIGMLKETLMLEIEDKRLICTGVIADIFFGLNDAITRARSKLMQKGFINQESDFLPSHSSLFITYLGNCLGNHLPDQEMELFSIVHSTFKNRPLEFLVGVSVMRAVADEYKRVWDDFLLETPRHLLETKKLLISHRKSSNKELPEFTLPKNKQASERRPATIPEPYLARHKIKGQIYRFYYRLAYDLSLASHLEKESALLPKGTLTLLFNIIKYDVKTLVKGIEQCGLFKIKHDEYYHQIVDTLEGKREYAVFSAYLS